MSHIAQLINEVGRILTPFGVNHKARSRIVDAYSEDWRGYHNASHIMQMLVLSRRFDIKLMDDDRLRLELMILYHDVWYKVGRPKGENERKSADWAYTDLVHHGFQFTDTIREGIEATINHNLVDVSSDNILVVATLLDLDLWGLGQKPEYFKRNGEMIWQEFQPVATRAEFKAGRATWAKDFLDSRKTIYHTESFAQFEAQARRNLQELAAS